MQPLYEKPNWTEDAKRYDNTSAFFAMVALIIGILGIFAAVIWFFIGLSGLSEGRLTDIVGSIALGFHSCVLLVFGSMMRTHSKILLAIFEMSLGETRLKIQSAPAESADS